MYLQLSISMWHSWRSMGKYCRFIGHDAVIVNLSGLFDIFFLLDGFWGKRDYTISSEFMGNQVYINKQTSRGFQKNYILFYIHTTFTRFWGLRVFKSLHTERVQLDMSYLLYIFLLLFFFYFGKWEILWVAV